MRLPRRPLPALLFLLLALGVTYRALLGPEMFYFRDLLSHHVPHLALGARLWRAEGPPLWSPLFDCGQPHLANPQNLALHPLQILYLLLPPDRAFAVSIALLLFLCGAGMYACARGLGAPVAGALAAGAAFELSGFVLSLGNLANLLATAAPLPLTLLFAVRAASSLGAGAGGGLRRCAPDLAAAGALFALQILGGEPFVAALCLAGIASILPSACAGGAARRWGIAAGVAAAVGALAALIDAAVLLPAAAFFPDTVRAWGFRPQGALLWSLHPVHLLEAIVPGIFGDPAAGSDAAFWGARLFDRGRPFILALGVGKVALAAAAAALWTAYGRRPEPDARSGAGEATRGVCWSPGLARGLAWTAAAFTLLALGRHGLLRLEWLGGLSSLPLVRYPSRFFLVPTFALCLLAAFGFEALASGRRREALGRACLAAGGALGLAASVAGALAAGGSIPEAAGHGVAGALARSALALGALCLALLLPERRGWGPRPRTLALLALVAAEPLWAYSALNPTAPRELLTRTPAAVERLRADPGRFRIWRDNSPRLEGLPEQVAPFLAPTIWFRETLHPSYGLELGLAYAFNTSGDESDSKRTFLLGKRLASADLPARARVLGAAGVKYFVAFGPAPLAASPAFEEVARIRLAGPDVWLWRNRLWIPTVRVVPGALLAEGPGAALERLLSPGYDPLREVVLEEAPSGSEPPAAGPVAGDRASAAAAHAPSAEAGSAEIVSERPSRIEIRARAERDAWLVLSDRYAGGWEARLDGGPVPIRRADYLFRAVRLPAGEHAVTFEYRPPGFRPGLFLSLAGVALALGLTAWGRGVRLS